MRNILKTAAAALVASTMTGEASAQTVAQSYPLPSIDMRTPTVPTINTQSNMTNTINVMHEKIETIKGPTKGSFTVSQRSGNELSGRSHQKNFANADACKSYVITLAEQSGDGANISGKCRNIKTDKLVGEVSCKKEFTNELSCKHRFDKEAADKTITSVEGKYKLYSRDDVYKTGSYETKILNFKSPGDCEDKMFGMAKEYNARVVGVCTNTKTKMSLTRRECMPGGTCMGL